MVFCLRWILISLFGLLSLFMWFELCLLGFDFFDVIMGSMILEFVFVEFVDLVVCVVEKYVVVVGGGIGGLIVVCECVKVGMCVMVLEVVDEFGGVICWVELDGVVIDVGVESYVIRGGVVCVLVDEFGLIDCVVVLCFGGVWVVGVFGVGVVFFLVGGIFGILVNFF